MIIVTEVIIMVLNNDNVHSSSYVELVAKRQWPFVLASDNFTILHLPPSCNQTDCTKSVKSVNQWIPSPKKNNNMGSRKPDLTRSVFPTSKPRKLLSKPRGQLDPGTKQGITKTKKKQTLPSLHLDSFIGSLISLMPNFNWTDISREIKPSP